MIKYIFLIMLILVPIATAEIQRVEIPLQIKLQNYSFTIIKQDDNSQYPYKSGDNVDTSTTLNLYTYYNFSNYCPDSDKVKSVCDNALNNLKDTTNAIKDAVQDQKSYFDKYTECLTNLGSTSTDRDNLKNTYADYPSLKQQKETCINTDLPRAQQELQQKNMDYTVLSSQFTSCQNDRDNYKSYIWWSILGGLIGGFGLCYLIYVRKNLVPGQSKGAEPPVVPIT